MLHAVPQCLRKANITLSVEANKPSKYKLSNDQLSYNNDLWTERLADVPAAEFLNKNKQCFIRFFTSLVWEGSIAQISLQTNKDCLP